MRPVSSIVRRGPCHAGFHRLDALIAAATEGCLGQGSWVSPDGGLRNATYFWRDEAALRAFARRPAHLEAKRQYRRWYEGYAVVVAELRSARGDGRLGPRIPEARGRR